MTEPASVQSSPPLPDWAQAVHAVWAAVRAGALGAGDLAELRRERPETPRSPAFWRVLATYVEPRWPLPRDPERRRLRETQWAVVLSNLSRNPHPGDHPAKGLAEAGYAELRFLRLLRADGPEFARQVRAAVTFLASKSMGLDWIPMAELVFSDAGENPNWAEEVRRGFARRFFGAQATRPETPEQQKED